MGRRPRRNHSPAFKAKVAVEATRGEKTLIELSQAHDVHPNQVKQWRDQLLEAVSDLAEGDIRLEARHDEVRLDLSVIYPGKAMAFPDRAPTADELLNDDDAMGRMAGWLVRNLADRATAFSRGGQQGVLLLFES